LAKLGFAFIELGTVTPRPQEGNPRPRLFRLPEVSGIINRMGFNNKGVDVLVEKVRRSEYKGILGINIGKNKDTPLSKAADDYIVCLQKVYPLASYVTINISSPNTPDLRQLQTGEYFRDLLFQIKNEHIKLADRYQKELPLLVKVSPDEAVETLKEMAEVMLHSGVKGIIASNTTCDRKMLPKISHAQEPGGLSGQPLRSKSTECLALLKSYVGDSLTLIGVGGIDSPQAVQEKLNAGASLVQVYSALIYQGPGLISRLTRPNIDSTSAQ
jgi:dihydroorotate dehydrogenase